MKEFNQALQSLLDSLDNSIDADHAVTALSVVVEKKQKFQKLKGRVKYGLALKQFRLSAVGKTYGNIIAHMDSALRGFDKYKKWENVTVNQAYKIFLKLLETEYRGTKVRLVSEKGKEAMKFFFKQYLMV